jgi:hypothetical protein
LNDEIREKYGHGPVLIAEEFEKTFYELVFDKLSDKYPNKVAISMNGNLQLVPFSQCSNKLLVISK